MVNLSLPQVVAGVLTLFFVRKCSSRAKPMSRSSRGVTSETRESTRILGKFDFLQLLENLRRILFDYGQKLPRPTNVTFKAAC